MYGCRFYFECKNDVWTSYMYHVLRPDFLLWAFSLVKKRQIKKKPNPQLLYVSCLKVDITIVSLVFRFPTVFIAPGFCRYRKEYICRNRNRQSIRNQLQPAKLLKEGNLRMLKWKNEWKNDFCEKTPKWC